MDQEPLLDYRGAPVRDNTRKFIVFPSRSHVLDHMNHLPQDIRIKYNDGRYIDAQGVRVQCITELSSEQMVGTLCAVEWRGVFPPY